MLILRGILFIVTIIIMNNSVHYTEDENRRVIDYFSFTISVLSGLTFCISLIFTNLNLLAIPKIILLVYICICICFKFKDSIFKLSLIIVSTTLLMFGKFYADNISVDPIQEEILLTSTEISIKTYSIFSNAEFEGVLYIDEPEEPVYKYYSPLDNGDFDLNSIPAKSTQRYYIKDDETPHIDMILITSYQLNYNYRPAKTFNEHSKIIYKLYVPKEAVVSIYSFN